ncbi:MAG: hypothetical protein ACM3NQ_04095 [Bacteroidales bacterium]
MRIARDSSRRLAAACGVLAVSAILLMLTPAVALPASAPAARQGEAAAPASPQAHSTEATPAGEATEHEAVHEEPLWKTLARVFNFAVLVGVLVYFLRAPIAGYLARRSTEIRSDLAKAAETREAATRDLALIDEKLASLPAQIEALKAHGAQDIAAEEARIRQAAETDRQRLLEQARREIDLQVRTAERDLVKHAADLAVELASKRIKANITGDDQDRLVDRYLSQLGK